MKYFLLVLLSIVFGCGTNAHECSFFKEGKTFQDIFPFAENIGFTNCKYLNTNSSCIGTLLTKDFVITAKHCVGHIDSTCFFYTSAPKLKNKKYEILKKHYYQDDNILSKSSLNGITSPDNDDVVLLQLKNEIEDNINDISLKENKIPEKEQEIIIFGANLYVYEKNVIFYNPDILYGCNTIDKLVSIKSILYFEYRHRPMTCNGDSGSLSIDVKTGNIIGIHSYGRCYNNDCDCKKLQCSGDVFVSPEIIKWVEETILNERKSNAVDLFF